MPTKKDILNEIPDKGAVYDGRAGKARWPACGHFVEIEVCGQMVKPKSSNDGEGGGHCKESNTEVGEGVPFTANPVFVAGLCGNTVRFTTVQLYRCAEGQLGF